MGSPSAFSPIVHCAPMVLRENIRKLAKRAIDRYEIELSWNSAANFELTVGVDKSRPTIRPAFRVETWGDELVIVRESERMADFYSLQKISPGPGQIHLQA